MAGGAWRAFVSGAPAVRRYYKTKEDKTAGKSAGSFDCRGASFERCADGSFVLTNRERELTLGLNPELLSVVVGDEGERWATALGAAREKADEKSVRARADLPASPHTPPPPTPPRAPCRRAPAAPPRQPRPSSPVAGPAAERRWRPLAPPQARLARIGGCM